MIPLPDVTYVLPIRRASIPPNDDLTPYLRGLTQLVAEVVVVDGSPPAVFQAHAAAWGSFVRHVGVDSAHRGGNGKVAGVRTGVALAATETIVIADDDVRYGAEPLRAVHDALAHADIVRPQNYFDPLPWHALLDEGRSLIARVTGGDWPGTLGVRRTAYLHAGGYNPDVLFENLELVRTIRASGGTERVLDSVFVSRRPPTFEHYLGQRVRHAYDEFARPVRLAVQLAIGPATLVAIRHAGLIGALVPAAIAILLAEAGRRRGGAVRYFPAAASLAAPLWVAERALTSWLALIARARGGVRYAGGRLHAAATPSSRLRARLRETVR